MFRDLWGSLSFGGLGELSSN
ncbi:unnamed protein product [Linum tenue]|uniref:Uncharacterized protein n=1 Tax=Linum tenue TaxID=586396 RepID=A0AAV0I3R4_9ROSI|nr:unnamed protein product [Linum tenue]